MSGRKRRRLEPELESVEATTRCPDAYALPTCSGSVRSTTTVGMLSSMHQPLSAALEPDTIGVTEAMIGGTLEPQQSPLEPESTTAIPAIPQLYIDQLASFSPVKEPWMSNKVYRPVGSTYITGRVCKVIKKSRKKEVLFELRWLDSQFQSHIEIVSLAIVQRGVRNYSLMASSSRGHRGWQSLCNTIDDDVASAGADFEELEEVDERFDAFQQDVQLPADLAEVEAIKTMRFEPDAQMEEPTDLYKHNDGTTETRIRPQYRFLFEHSAVSSFLAYLPMHFWRQVLYETNQYAKQHGIALGRDFTIDELMRFIGILLYMTLTNKGEYANYWGEQVEDQIFGVRQPTGLDEVMPLRRFKLLRQSFCFRSEVSAETLQRDGAARIRSVLNILKTTCSKYVDVGRDIALDEASVACRSKFGRKLIVYNPKKPSGKYHFRFYVACCATTWLVLNYRLHGHSSFSDRHMGVVTNAAADSLAQDIAGVSTIRGHVLEVVRPFYFTKRIVTTDNFYTSVQLLEALRVKGLYGRGTVRSNSKHFPQHIMLDKRNCVRGDFKQGVAPHHRIVAASWCDGSIVSIVSNADSSTVTTVRRLVGSETHSYPSPLCVERYNANMQGVDRHDQLRARFSVADGHSFKKWHKKLSLAIVDIARCNAFVSRKMVLGSRTTTDRDPHRTFMIELVSELLSGKWMEAPGDERLAFGICSGLTRQPQFSSPASSTSSRRSMPSSSDDSPQQLACKTVSSKQLFASQNKKRRWCVVCKWEGRTPTVVTDYCIKHCVCLCQMVHHTQPSPYTCTERTWTCWEKYHRYYLPRKLYNAKGNLRTSSALYKLKQTSATDQPTRSVARTIAL